MNTICIASETDLDAINRIRSAIDMDETSEHKLSNIGVEEIEGNTDSLTLVCFQNSILVGYLRFYSTNQFGDKSDAMMEMFVHPACQRQGLGTMLIEACFAHAHEGLRFGRIVLGVLNENIDAIALYERHGFQIFQEDAIGKYMSCDV